MRNLATASILVLAACLNVGEPQAQSEQTRYAYEIPKAPVAAVADVDAPPVVGDASAPEFIADVSDIQLPSDGPTITYVERQVCGPNGCQIVRIPVQSSASSSTEVVSSSSGVSSSMPAAAATFSGTRLQFKRGQPLRNFGRVLVRSGWRMSGGAIRARRRCCR